MPPDLKIRKSQTNALSSARDLGYYANSVKIQHLEAIKDLKLSALPHLLIYRFR